MFIVITLAAVYLAGNVASAATVPHYEKVYYDLDNADSLYKEYLEVHKKHYATEEYRMRLEIFKENLKYFNEQNAIYPLTVFGPTVVSDMTVEERKRLRGVPAVNINSTKAVSLELDPNMVYEDSFDWRDKGAVTPVKDQDVPASCGSCYIFSAIGSIEGQYAIKHQECLSFSEQEALDCVQNSGCDGGFPVDIMNELAGDSSALMLESDYPYTAVKGQCVEDGSKKRATVQSGQQLDASDEEVLKNYLVQYGPLSIVVDASDFDSYHGGIMHPQTCGTSLDHAVLLVGYGEEADTPYWIIKNSWGLVFGEQGYIRMQRGVKACGIGMNVATSTVA